jgi:transcriptional regulator with XRE-family HTH domain
MFILDAMGLGQRIRGQRLARGWTLEKLEELSGVAAGTIHALEQRDSARSKYFPALARAFGLTLEDLELDEPPPPIPKAKASEPKAPAVYLDANGLTPEALKIAQWFDRITDERERVIAEVEAMAVILRVLQHLPPTGAPWPDSRGETPPEPSPPLAPASPPKHSSNPGDQAGQSTHKVR